MGENYKYKKDIGLLILCVTKKNWAMMKKEQNPSKIQKSTLSLTISFCFYFLLIERLLPKEYDCKCINDTTQLTDNSSLSIL